MSGALNDRSAGPWAVAFAATAAVMVGGLYLGSAGFAQASSDPDINNVGSPGRDGQSVTCYAYPSSLDTAPICNAVSNGEDGEPGAVYR